MKLTYVVAKDGTGDFTTVQTAIDTVSVKHGEPVTIQIREGIYEEVIHIDQTKSGLHLIGDGAGKTILTYGNFAGKLKEDGTKLGTGQSASVFIDADEFSAVGITFENSYYEPGLDHSGRQAVAVNTTGQHVRFTDCSFLGYQDTLYLRDGSCFLKNCYLEGDIDFIFGAAQAVFEDCEICSINPCNQENNGYCTAASTRESAEYGFVFYHCKLTAAADMPDNSVYLGRPWHPSKCDGPVRSYTLFYECELGAHIRKEGWTIMGTTHPETERYYEYHNTGKGAMINIDRPQLSVNEAMNIQTMIKNE